MSDVHFTYFKYNDFAKKDPEEVSDLLKGGNISVDDIDLEDSFVKYFNSILEYRKSGTHMPICKGEDDIEIFNLALKITMPIRTKIVNHSPEVIINNNHYFYSGSEFYSFIQEQRKLGSDIVFPVLVESDRFVVGMLHDKTFSFNKDTLMIKGI